MVVWLIGGAAWVLLGSWALARGVARWKWVPLSLRLLLGLAALWLAFLAVAQARLLGVGYLLSLLTLVWMADVAAYFGGKTLSSRFPAKLAPTVSPGKTWVGAISGTIGVVALALVWVSLESVSAQPSLHKQLHGLGGVALLTLACVFLSAMSVVGDLVESLVKRSADMKDSSQLLPGHGGVLDRVDALLPALPLAMMLSALVRG